MGEVGDRLKDLQVSIPLEAPKTSLMLITFCQWDVQCVPVVWSGRLACTGGGGRVREVTMVIKMVVMVVGGGHGGGGGVVVGMVGRVVGMMVVGRGW